MSDWEDAEAHYAALAEQAAHEEALEERNMGVVDVDAHCFVNCNRLTVAALRRKARAHERLAGLRCSPALRQWWDWDLARYHEGAADALEAMAERIERGDV